MIEKNPMVSVIMPVYRCEKYIKESIESILNQTFKDFELIIVSDDSTYEMRSILDIFQQSDSRIIVVHQDRKGYFFSRNQCCAMARGIYVAVMDCDDISHSGRLEDQVHFLEVHPDIGAVGSWYKIIDESGNVNGKRQPSTLPSVVRWTLLFGNTLGHGTIMMRRKILEDVGFYKSGDIGFCEDYDLWNRFLKHANIANIPKFLLKYRVRNESITKKQESQLYSNAIEISRSQISELLKQPVEYGYAKKLYTMKNIETISDVEYLIKLLEGMRSLFFHTYACSSVEKKLINKDTSVRMAYICLASARSTRFRSLLFFKSGIILNPLLVFYLPINVISRIMINLG
jgi:glycosyltransferase involved in cell wall biosynthesis